MLRNTAEGREAIKAVEAGAISQRHYEITIGRLLGVDDRGLLIRALAGLRPRPEILELIRRARSAGIRVALLSNSWGDGEYDPYDGYDLDAMFDTVVISGETGMRKPDPAMPSGNNLAPIDGGEPNTSNGPATNQCADLT